MKDIKQIIVVRKDLNMRRGKESAQCCHASLQAIMNNNLPELSYQCGDLYLDVVVRFTMQMKSWYNNLQKKVVVSCNSEEELLELQKQAEDAGIVNALILDSGFTEFKEDCPECSGKGETMHSRKPMSITDTPSVEYYKCQPCNGTGKVSKPTYTCLAIGPDYSDKIDKITGHLKLR